MVLGTNTAKPLLQSSMYAKATQGFAVYGAIETFVQGYSRAQEGYQMASQFAKSEGVQGFLKSMEKNLEHGLHNDRSYFPEP